MIWHVLEVWALLVAMFAIGCVAGAFGYGAIGRSRLATAQGVVADTVGDVIDSIKARIGMAPAWRPGRLRNLDRPTPPPRKALPTYVEPSLSVPGDPVVATAAPTSSAYGQAVALPAAQSIEDEADAAGDDDDAITAETSVDARAASAMRVADDGIMPKRPPGLAVPRGGAPDNLQRIKGIGRRNEVLLNSLGIYHFGQIAAWTPAEIRWIGQYLSFPDRIERDDWAGQATLLAMGNDTGFEKSADRRRRRRREQRQFADRLATATNATDLAERAEPWDEADPYAIASETILVEGETLDPANPHLLYVEESGEYAEDSSSEEFDAESTEEGADTYEDDDTRRRS